MSGPLIQCIVKLVCKLLVLLPVHLIHDCDHSLHSSPVGKAEQEEIREAWPGLWAPSVVWLGLGPSPQWLPHADCSDCADGQHSPEVAAAYLSGA